MSHWAVQNSFSVIGTLTVPIALTDTWAVDAAWGNPFPIGGMQQLAIKGSYTPKAGQTNRYLKLRVSTGATETTVVPIDTVDYNSAEYDQYENYFVIPGSKSTSGGTQYTFNLQVPLADKYCKIEVAEDSTGNNGTVVVEVTLSGK